jgi:methionyl-tRNA formyltransferase
VRFLDVVLFRLYAGLFIAPREREWQRDKLAELRRAYAQLPSGLPALVIDSPNRPEAEAFIRRLAPDLVIARCKTLLREGVFSIPPLGTFVMHPGICPEYRNAHGCFWALANGDVDRVGMTLLRIDRGVDTGPVYGYYTYPFDEARESPARIQARVVFENLDALRDRLLEIAAGAVKPLDTGGRRSAVWGQPWLTTYVRWKFKTRRGSR